MRNSGWRQLFWEKQVVCEAFGRLQRIAFAVVLLCTLLAVSGFQRSVQGQTINAVLFFSPTCQHCHDVITRYLPVLFRDFGGPHALAIDSTVPQAECALYAFHNGRLQFLLVDISKTKGAGLYMASNLNQAVPEDSMGVPRLVIGETVLIGSYDIPARTSGIVALANENGGLEWPQIDGLDEALLSFPGLTTTAPVADEDSIVAAVTEPPAETAAGADTATPPEISHDTAASTPLDSAAGVEVSEVSDSGESSGETPVDASGETPVDASETETDSAASTNSLSDVMLPQNQSMIENFRVDPVGNSFSVVILLVMIASLAAVVLKARNLPPTWGVGLGIPILAVVGAFVAGYLTYIEATGATAVCGPVGDCNTVNQSEYARLFGVLPVGALGLMGYAAILIAWALSKSASGSATSWAKVGLLVMTIGGVLFSIYLTFLEPFVIGATCAWCLTSSVIITVLMWLSAGLGSEAWVSIRNSTAVD